MKARFVFLVLFLSASCSLNAASTTLEDEAHTTLLRFSEFQKIFYKKNLRYAMDMIELIGSLKRKPPNKNSKDKILDPILNSQFVVAYSPICILSSPNAKKANKPPLLWYPELPDEKKSLLKLSKKLANNFELLIKKKIKDLPKGKCPPSTKGYELYAIGFKDDAKTTVSWSIDQDLKFKKIR